MSHLQRTTQGVRAALLSAALAMAASAARAQTGSVQHVHDPCIIREAGTYYVFSTNGGIHIRRSRDLVRWEYVGQVFDPFPAWTRESVPGVKELWAPDISRFNGLYHLYYSVSTFGRNRSSIGLATNATLDPASPDYRWVDRGEVLSSRPGKDDWNAIDPNFVLDPQGAPWLAFGSFWDGIKLRRLDPLTGKPSRRHRRLHALARRQDPPSVEAPFLVWREGFAYLFVSFGRCGGRHDSDYRIAVGRSRRLTGSYVDRQGRAMMDGGGTLVLASHDHVRGPGHCAVLREGDSWWLVHHFYDARHRYVPTLHIRPVLWAPDGWPLAGEPLHAAPGTPAAAPPDVTGAWHHSVNFGAPGPLTLHPNGRINDPKGPARWALDGRVLTLRWPRADAPGGAWVDQCVVGLRGDCYVGRNQQDMLIRGVRPKRQ